MSSSAIIRCVVVPSGECLRGLGRDWLDS